MHAASFQRALSGLYSRLDTTPVGWLEHLAGWLLQTELPLVMFWH